MLRKNGNLSEKVRANSVPDFEGYQRWRDSFLFTAHHAKRGKYESTWIRYWRWTGIGRWRSRPKWKTDQELRPRLGEGMEACACLQCSGKRVQVLSGINLCDRIFSYWRSCSQYARPMHVHHRRRLKAFRFPRLSQHLKLLRRRLCIATRMTANP